MKINTIAIIKKFLKYSSSLLFKSQKSLEDFKKNCKANKILVISLTHLGDTVLLSPFLYNLRRNFPVAKIDILLKGQVSEILEYCPHINNRIIYNAKWVTSKKGDGFVRTLTLIYHLKKNRYDLSFITHPHIFSNIISWLAKIPFRVGYSDEADGFLNIRLKKTRHVQHTRDYILDLLRYLDLKVESHNLEIYLGRKDYIFAEDFLKNTSLSNSTFLIGIHPGAGNQKRIWLPERYARVIQYLINKYNAHILLFASKQEVNITKEIKTFLVGYQQRISDFTGKTTIRQMAALMELCEVILANDAGPMHVACALGKPTLALFMSTPTYWSNIWGPLSEGSRIVSGANNKVSRPEDIRVKDVIKALDELIELKIKTYR